MFFRRIATVGVLLLPCSLVQAQIGVYGKFDVNHYHDHTSDEMSQWFYGGGLGIYDDFLGLGPVRAGLDLRGDMQAGGDYGYQSLLGGVRVAVKPPLIGLRPYVQASIGFGGVKDTGRLPAFVRGTAYDRKLLYTFLGGLDYTILPRLDWRVAEVGYGRQTAISSYPNAPASTLVMVSTGLVLRLR